MILHIRIPKKISERSDQLTGLMIGCDQVAGVRLKDRRRWKRPNTRTRAEISSLAASIASRIGASRTTGPIWPVMIPQQQFQAFSFKRWSSSA